MRSLYRLAVSLGLLLACLAWVRAGEQEAANKIIDRAIKESGGAAKIVQLTSVKVKGKINFEAGGQQIAMNYELALQNWDKLRMEAELQINGMNQNILLVGNKDKGWAKSMDKVVDLPAKDFAAVRDVMFSLRVPQLLGALKGKEFEVSHLGEVKIGTEPALGLRIIRKGRPDVSLFFDKKSGLPVKAAVRISDPQGKELDVEMLLKQYKEFDGLKHCSEVLFKVDGKEFTIQISELAPQEKLDESIFARP